MGIINQYPYTDLHSINLDYIIKLCRENMGLHLEISGNSLLLKTEDNTIISSVTIPYATEAGTANSATQANYATSSGVAATANYATTAGSATTADTATNATHAVTADSATSATTANSAATANYATSAGSANTATTATSASTADYATNAGSVAHTTNGIETVTVDGNEIKFTTYGGNTTSITSPYSVKASKDDIGNIIKNTYFANVVDDSGVLKFNDAQGNTLVSLTPTAAIATSDSYNNTIADYIKTILVSSNSDYVTVTHGTGTTDSLTIHYSETAWKDTNGNVIKNTYIKRMECIVDPNDSKYKLVAYNGDTPEAELFRIELSCENARNAVHATTADTATYATNANYANNAAYATTAGTATTATSADTAKDGYYIMKIQHDPNDPSTYEYVGTYDSKGNTIDISDIRHDNRFNMYIELYHNVYSPSWSEYYTVVSYGYSGPNSPYYFHAISSPVEGSGVWENNKAFTEASMNVLSVGILNNAVIAVDLDDRSLEFKFDNEAILLESTVDILSLAVNGSTNVDSEIDFDDWQSDLSDGVRFFKTNISDGTNKYTVDVNYNNGDVEFFIWDSNNSAFRRFVITDNGTYSLTITRTN